MQPSGGAQHGESKQWAQAPIQTFTRAWRHCNEYSGNIEAKVPVSESSPDSFLLFSHNSFPSIQHSSTLVKLPGLAAQIHYLLALPPWPSCLLSLCLSSSSTKCYCSDELMNYTLKPCEQYSVNNFPRVVLSNTDGTELSAFLLTLSHLVLVRNCAWLLVTETWNISGLNKIGIDFLLTKKKYKAGVVCPPKYQCNAHFAFLCYP